jgi:uncharacterized membrane protein YfcA
VLGTLRLPLMILLATSPSAAAGTNIGISAASAAAGSVRHAREGRVSWKVVAWMLPPSVAGAFVGGYIGRDVPEQALLGVAAAILLYNGIDLLVRPFRAHSRTRLRVAPAVVGGLGIGALGGAIGVILGTMRMPVLLRGVGMTAARAVGTNLVVGFAVGVVGLGAHAARLEVEWGLLAAGAPAALVGGWLGARVTGRLSELFLRRAIGAALVLIAVALAVEAGLN